MTDRGLDSVLSERCHPLKASALKKAFSQAVVFLIASLIHYASSSSLSSAASFSLEPSDEGAADQETCEGNSKFYHTSSANPTHSHTSHSTKYTSDDEESSSITSGSGKLGMGTPAGGAAASGGTSSLSPARRLTPATISHGINEGAISGLATVIDLEPVIAELQNRRDEVRRLSAEIESLKSQLQTDCTVFHQSLQEERYRFEVRFARANSIRKVIPML